MTTNGMNGVKATSVATVDFGPFLKGSQKEKKDVAQQLDAAFQDTGFVCLTNHGVSEAEIQECFDWSKRFFALPTSTKNLAPHPPGGAHHRGYSGIGREQVSQTAEDGGLGHVGEIKESFESGNVADPYQPNIWFADTELPGFRAFMEEYFLTCTALVNRVFDALDTALDLSQDWRLEKKHTKELFQLRLLHYPAVPKKVFNSGETQRIGAHADFGTLTLLWQDSVGGLEIRNPHSGEWMGVPYVPGGVLVNVADCLQRWSNGRWKSAVHRVVAPPADALEKNGDSEGVVPPRYSIPFFAGADADAMIETLPGCEGPNGEKLEAIGAMDYIIGKMNQTY